MIGDNTDLTSKIRQEALRLGFLDCGFSRVKPLLEIENSYHAWLAKGYHAGMDYMARNIDKRLDPSLLVPGAKSVISLLYNYYPSQWAAAQVPTSSGVVVSTIKCSSSLQPIP